MYTFVNYMSESNVYVIFMQQILEIDRLLYKICGYVDDIHLVRFYLSPLPSQVFNLDMLFFFSLFWITSEVVNPKKLESAFVRNIVFKFYDEANIFF